MIILKIDIIVKIYEKRCEHMSFQNQTEGFTQAITEMPCRSPELVLFIDFIGLYLIFPDLPWFVNLGLVMSNCDWQF